MIEVLIKSVSPFAEYNGLIYSYLVKCCLKNGSEIIFVDERPFDLSNQINKKVSVELASNFLNEKNDCDFLFKGKIEYSKSSDEFYFVGDTLKIFIPKVVAECSSVELNKVKEYCFEELILRKINQ